MFSLNIIDVSIILILLLGIVVGFKRGAIKTAVELLSIIVVLFISYKLKNPLSIFMYKHLPFFPLGGLSVLNILIYEAIAFLICFSLLMIIAKILIRLSGILDRILKATIILNLPSRLIGAVLGLLQNYIIIFMALFILTQISVGNDLINESKYADIILKNTPVLNKISQNSYNALKEVSTISKDYQKNDINKANYEALKIMLDNKIISKENVLYLVNKNKLKIANVNSLINN